jgi:hypothetical protein
MQSSAPPIVEVVTPSVSDRRLGITGGDVANLSEDTSIFTPYPEAALDGLVERQQSVLNAFRHPL